MFVFCFFLYTDPYLGHTSKSTAEAIDMVYLLMYYVFWGSNQFYIISAI